MEQNNQTSTSREELKRIISSKYPDIWMRDSEQFDHTRGCIWTGKGTFQTLDYERIQLFDLNAKPSAYQYVEGVYYKLFILLEQNNWKAMFFEPDVVFLIPLFKQDFSSKEEKF